MAYVDLKELKQNKGTTVKLRLNSSAEYVEKEYNGKTFNIYNYNVIQDNRELQLSASDSLKRKLDEFSTGDEFVLSFEEFTKDGQMRNYWKVQRVVKDAQQYENVKKPVDKSINEFDALLKKDNPVVKKFTNEGARFGMIFNQTMNLYMHFSCEWNQKEFVANFNRVSDYVEACENQDTVPSGEKARIKAELAVIKEEINQQVKEKPVETQQFNPDDLPF